MTSLYKLISSSDDWLVHRILQYAEKHGYATFISLPEETWRASLTEICREFLKTLHSGKTPLDLKPDTDYTMDPVAVLGSKVANRHQKRGVTFAAFFGLVKYYRQSFVDLVQAGGLEPADVEAGRMIVERFFDRLEIGFLAEWSRFSRAELFRDLQGSESRFTALASQAPVGIFETDANGDCLFVNERWCKIAGMAPEEAQGKGWASSIHPLDRERVIAEWYAAAGAQREFALEYRFQTPEGITTWVFGRAKATRDENGKVIGYLGTIQDIHEQKRDREEIQRLNAELEQRVIQRTAQLSMLSKENDKKLQELSFLYRMSNTMLSTIQLNKLPHLILSALTSGDTPFFDRAMLFLTNERSATMQGMLGVTRQTSAGLINPAAEMEDLLAGRFDMSEEDMERQRDSEFSCQVRGSRLELNRSRNAASRAVLGKKLILVADTAREKGIDHDFVGRFGIKAFAVAPLMAKDKVVGVVVVDNILSERSISKDDLRFLQLFTNQAGMAIENSILYNRLEDANRSLREAREHLVQGERLSTIGEMATSIAHEIKSPLVSIGGFARRLEKNLPASLIEHQHAATIVREVQRLEKMLTDILSFSRKTTICYSLCTISDIVEESLAILADALDENRVKVYKSYPRKVISLLGDSQQLKQVFLNLLMNAQEAMQNGGELRITVTSARLNGTDAVSVKVADTGGGIPLETLNNIFNSFFTTKEAGTGLGLPIANRIVTNHGGKIQVNNKVGFGVEFNVILPLTP